MLKTKNLLDTMKANINSFGMESKGFEDVFDFQLMYCIFSLRNSRKGCFSYSYNVYELKRGLDQHQSSR